MRSLVSYVGTRALRWRLLYGVRFAFRLFGGNWNDFYAWMLDFQDRRVTLDQILARPRNDRKFKGLWDWWRGEYCVEYMRRHGLQPTHTVLDYGCGYGRVTIPLLKFQTPGGCYIGTEISTRRLELAREWIAREGLGGKSCELVLSKDNRMAFLADGSVDAVWVLSVFNHMPDAELETTLAALHRVMRGGGKLYCYYLVPVPGGDETVKTFRRTAEDMTALLARIGFTSQIMPDWDDDLGEARSTESRMQICVKSEFGPVT
ncbi:MAG: class I SAM-dependent methyltransferase [Alphaproteobacteria bacterium]|nr:class I SAM-dependent methyltransferase [Alphaproteobacteria bacterium]